MKTNSPRATMLSVAMLLCALPALAQIEINNIDELQLIGFLPAYPSDGDYVLGNDIDASATATWNGGAGFVPIGNSTNSFTGTFDGEGYVVTGLTINRPTEDYIGLFGYASSATLQNIALENLDVTGRDKVGGLVGEKWYGYITNCYSTGMVSATRFYSDYVGGLIGYNNGAITSSHSACVVTGSYDYVVVGHYGGLVGTNYGSITYCYSTGTVTGVGFGTGGLVGNNSGNIHK